MVKIKGKRTVKNKQQKLLIKYDKNNDDIISLKEYLAEETSTGPKAKATNIKYHYQHYENVYNYFMILLTKQKKFKIVCIPNFILYFNNYTERTALAYNIETNELYYAFSFKNSIIKCAKKDNVRFIFLSFIIIQNNKTKINHANIIIIDVIKKTFERFEPYGKYTDNIKITKQIDNVFQTKFKSLLDINNFTYISPTYISPLVGIQSIADSYCGMCITINMMYLHMRVLNPDISQPKLVNFILKRNRLDLKKMILKYAKHVENTLKDNKSFIKSLIKKISK